MMIEQRVYIFDFISELQGCNQIKITFGERDFTKPICDDEDDSVGIEIQSFKGSKGPHLKFKSRNAFFHVAEHNVIGYIVDVNDSDELLDLKNKLKTVSQFAEGNGLQVLHSLIERVDNRLQEINATSDSLGD
jgi:hypothetical protein